MHALVHKPRLAACASAARDCCGNFFCYAARLSDYRHGQVGWQRTCMHADRHHPCPSTPGEARITMPPGCRHPACCICASKAQHRPAPAWPWRRLVLKQWVRSGFRGRLIRLVLGIGLLCHPQGVLKRASQSRRGIVMPPRNRAARPAMVGHDARWEILYGEMLFREEPPYDLNNRCPRAPAVANLHG